MSPVHSFPEKKQAQAPASVEQSIYAHFSQIVSAVNGEKVTSETPLAALYKFKGNDPAIDNTLLKNLTSIAEPAVRCGLLIGANKWYPPSSKLGQSGYDLYITFNKLMFAPCVRLECRFTGNPGDVPYHTVALEFHFHVTDHKVLTGFYIRETDQHTHVHFRANGASFSGFNKLKQFEHRFGQSQNEIVEFLKQLRDGENFRRLQFDLRAGDVSAAESRQLRAIYARLPGGEGPLLPSFGSPQYHMFSDRATHVRVKPDIMRNPFQLMTNKVPFPMVPLRCEDTFASVREASVQLAYSAYFADEEARVALNLWAASLHNAKLFRIGRFPVLAIDFGSFKKLGGKSDEVKYRLPEELSARMVFPCHSDFTFEGYLESETLGLPPHDAFFIVTNRSIEEFEMTFGIEIGVDEQSRAVRFRPNHLRSTYIAQLDTVETIQTSSCLRWHPLLLNQCHEKIPDVDMTAGLDIEPKLIVEADKWLHNWMDWNIEQKQILRSIHKAKGGVSLTMGIAGTGKSTVQSALAMYFVKLGFKCLICTPANSNADHSTRDIYDFTQASFEGKDGKKTGYTRDLATVRVHRLYPSSRDNGLQKMSQSPIQRDLSKIYGLELKLHSRKDRKTGARQLAIEQAVIDEADKAKLSLVTRLKSPDGQETSEPVDVWEVFRDHLNASRNGLFDWDDATHVAEYSRSYEQCRNHVVALSDVLATTTGNARCDELLTAWKDSDKTYGTECKGIIVLCDEAAKDLEVNTWIPILAVNDLVKGVFVFGDDKQLKPTNTCAQGDIEFNPFNQRLSTPLTDRLIREGFPYVALREQQRMHPCLSEFPNFEFYKGTLRDGARVKVALDSVKPGLSQVLHGILAKSFQPKNTTERTTNPLTDEIARHAYLEIPGQREEHPRTGSKVVRAHIDTFFAKVFPDLQAYFGADTHQSLMIICGYSYALHHYKAKIHELQGQQALPPTHFPNIVSDEPNPLDPDRAHPRALTIDTAQGQEAFMVIMDGSFQHRDRMGFMTDPGRCNVAMTRAKGVFWILGGALDHKTPPPRAGSSAALAKKNAKVPPFARLKMEMSWMGKVHRLAADE